MEKYKLNNTPLRTSNNYGINNINLELEIPTIKEFQNFSISTYESEEDVIFNYNVGKKINSKIGMELTSNNEISITIPEYKECKTPIIIDYEFDGDNNVLVDNIRIIAEKNSKVKVIILYYTDENENNFFHHLKQECVIKDNAEVNIQIINLLNESAKNFFAVENEVYENTKLEHTIIDLGGEIKVSNYNSKLIGNNSENNLKSIYIGTNNDIIDINYNIETIGKNTKCDIDTKGALSGKAHKNFKGTIDFKKGSIKAKGKEHENCILLSKTSKSKSLPMLLCHEEDVEGEHSVATGKPNEQEVFYLMSRGINYNDARKLLVNASFDYIVKEIKEEKIRQRVEHKISSLLKL